MNKTTSLASSALVIMLIIQLLTGCANMSEGTKRGAAGGALIGLTAGVLTGDASLAAAGAVAGGVAGGVGGSWSDYEADRKDHRVDTLAGAIASKGSGGEGEAPDSWHDIDAFVGRWQINMWWLDDKGQRIDATAQASSSLNSTKSVTFHFSKFQSSDFTDNISGTMTLDYKEDRGFELLNQFSLSSSGNRYVGHYDNQNGKYKFFYAGSNQDTFTGIRRSDYRVDMQMIGKDVIVIETWAAVGSEEKRVQSYRLTRQG